MQTDVALIGSYKRRVLDRWKLRLGEVDIALDPEVGVFVERQELDSVERVDQVAVPEVDRLDVLREEKVELVDQSLRAERGGTVVPKERWGRVVPKEAAASALITPVGTPAGTPAGNPAPSAGRLTSGGLQGNEAAALVHRPSYIP